MEVRISPRTRWDARLNLPGDKSLSHRALIMGSIASGRTEVKGLLASEDCLSTMACLQSLGAKIERKSPDSLVIEGKGMKAFREPLDILQAGNSGTTIRLLSGILAGLPFFCCITGDSSLNRRPMKRVIDPLKMMGASIWARDNGSYAPLAFNGSRLSAIDYPMPVASAQVKSALMLAGLSASGRTSITEPLATRNHTENMLRAMEVPVRTEENTIIIEGPVECLRPLSLSIPGDFSSAAFFIAAAALLSQGRLTLCNIGVNSTRTGFAEILQAMGVTMAYRNTMEILPGEPCADITVESAALRAVQVGREIVPRAIDEFPLLAVLATQAQGVTTVRGAEELRVKESDRIDAITAELKKMGASIETAPDGFTVEGPTPLRGARCRSHGDHRIAMSIAIAALIAKGDTVIEDAECVAISFPEFFTLLNEGTCS